MTTIALADSMSPQPVAPAGATSAPEVAPSRTVAQVAQAWCLDAAETASGLQMRQFYESVVHDYLIPALGSRTVTSLGREDFDLLYGQLRSTPGPHGRSMNADTAEAAMQVAYAAVGRSDQLAPGMRVVRGAGAALSPLHVLQLAIQYAPARWGYFLAIQAITGKSAHELSEMRDVPRAWERDSLLRWAITPFRRHIPGEPVFQLVDGTPMAAGAFESQVWPALSVRLGLTADYKLDPVQVARDVKAQIFSLQGRSTGERWARLHRYGPFFIARWMDSLDLTDPIATAFQTAVMKARRKPTSAPIVKAMQAFGLNISPDPIAQLHDAVQYVSGKLERRWLDICSELVFLGSFSSSDRISGPAPLMDWISVQRTEYRNGTLPACREELLREADFPFDLTIEERKHKPRGTSSRPAHAHTLGSSARLMKRVENMRQVANPLLLPAECKTLWEVGAAIRLRVWDGNAALDLAGEAPKAMLCEAWNDLSALPAEYASGWDLDRPYCSCSWTENLSHVYRVWSMTSVEGRRLLLTADLDAPIADAMACAPSRYIGNWRQWATEKTAVTEADSTAWKALRTHFGTFKAMCEHEPGVWVRGSQHYPQTHLAVRKLKSYFKRGRLYPTAQILLGGLDFYWGPRRKPASQLFDDFNATEKMSAAKPADAVGSASARVNNSHPQQRTPGSPDSELSPNPGLCSAQDTARFQSVQEVAQEWLIDAIPISAGEKTAAFYETVINGFLIPEFGSRWASSLSKEDFSRLRDKLGRARNSDRKRMTYDTVCAAMQVVYAALGRQELLAPVTSVVQQHCSALQPLHILQLVIQHAPARWGEFLAAQAITGMTADALGALRVGGAKAAELLAAPSGTPLHWAMAPFARQASQGKPLFALADGSTMDATSFARVWPRLAQKLRLAEDFRLAPDEIARDVRSQLSSLQGSSTEELWADLQRFGPFFIARWYDSHGNHRPNWIQTLMARVRRGHEVDVVAKAVVVYGLDISREPAAAPEDTVKRVGATVDRRWLATYAELSALWDHKHTGLVGSTHPMYWWSVSQRRAYRKGSLQPWQERMLRAVELRLAAPKPEPSPRPKSTNTRPEKVRLQARRNFMERARNMRREVDTALVPADCIALWSFGAAVRLRLWEGSAKIDFTSLAPKGLLAQAWNDLSSFPAQYASGWNLESPVLTDWTDDLSHLYRKWVQTSATGREVVLTADLDVPIADAMSFVAARYADSGAWEEWAFNKSVAPTPTATAWVTLRKHYMTLKAMCERKPGIWLRDTKDLHKLVVALRTMERSAKAGRLQPTAKILLGNLDFYLGPKKTPARHSFDRDVQTDGTMADLPGDFEAEGVTK